MKGGALTDITGTYRYALCRDWAPALPPLAVVMLNPSTATATEDDATIRRCLGFALRDGFGHLLVVNRSPFRARDPKNLAAHRPAAGVLVTNEEVIRREVGMVVRFGGAVVAAWGAHKVDPLFSTDVQEIAQSAGWPLQCWGTTKDGHPRHPLYLPADAERVRWPE